MDRSEVLRVNANAIVTNSEGKILVIKLKKGPFADSFSLPGGGIDFCELSNKAAEREIFEETGIKINKIKPLGFCELINNSRPDGKIAKGHRVVLLLQALAEGTPKESDEGVSQWMTYEEAKATKKLIPFAEETLNIWKNKETHFVLLEDKVLKL